MTYLKVTQVTADKECMGYIVRVNGSKWKLMLREGRKETHVSLSALPQGMLRTFNLEEARIAASRLNVDTRTKLSSYAHTRANVRLEKATKQLQSVFPASQLETFEAFIKTRYRTRAHRLLGQWRTALLRLQGGNEDFIKACLVYGYSPDYVDRLIKIANLWFKHTHQACRLEPLKGDDRRDVYEQFHAREEQFEADPLDTDHLLVLKDHLTLKQYNYMFISLWLGLRPSEIFDRIFKQVSKDGKQWLRVYQSKLIRVKPNKRWKTIPLCHPEMREAERLFTEGDFEEPLVKTLKRYLPGFKAGLYSGRKGFITHMLNKGHRLEDASIWLGHKSLDRTLRNYYDWNVLHWPKE